MPTSVQADSLSTTARVAISLLLLALIVGGGFLLRRGLHGVETAFASKSWPTVEGMVRRSTVKETVTPIKKNGREVPNKKSRSFSPDIEYSYTVQGKEYRGQRVTIDDASLGTRASAQAIVDQYPANKPVTVSYEAADPASSVLQPGDWTGTYRWFLPGGILVLIPLIVLRGIWGGPTEPTLVEVRADENHPARSRLLNGVLMSEEIVEWNPGQTVHLRRARVGFIKVIAGAIIFGLVLAWPVGAIPAWFFLSGRGVLFVAQCYLAAAISLSVICAGALMLWGRRREYLLDWTLGHVHWEIGWTMRDAPLDSIEQLTLNLPAQDSQRNPIVDSHTIQATIQGRTYTLLETNGEGLSWGETRFRLTELIKPFAHELQVPWTEFHQKSIKGT